MREQFSKLFSSSGNKISNRGKLVTGDGSAIRNSKITIGDKAALILGNNVCIDGYEINLQQGELRIGEHSLLQKGNNAVRPSLSLENGTISIGHHSIIRSDFSVRFGGICVIGNYTGIMEGTEIRCDESVSIGDFNMISYECILYDTNTHCMYPAEKRRKLTTKDFPSIGSEHEKPKTSPLKIGDDCWIGKRVTILKGVRIGNEVVVAVAAVVTKSVPDKNMAYGNPAAFKPKKED